MRDISRFLDVRDEDYLFFFSDPASGRTSGNRENIQKQVPHSSEEDHGARSGESDVDHPGCGGRGVCMSVTCVG